MQRDARRRRCKIVEQCLQVEKGSHQGQSFVCWGHFEDYEDTEKSAMKSTLRFR